MPTLFTFHRQQAIRMKILLMAISVIAHILRDAFLQVRNFKSIHSLKFGRDLLIQQTCKSFSIRGGAST